MTCLVCGGDALRDESLEPAELFRCSACSFMFPPARSAAELQDLYDKDYFDEYPGGEGYEEDEAQRRYEARIRVELVRRFRQSGAVLEVGAAAGHFLDEVRSAGYDPIGIEPAAEVARQASRTLGIDIRSGFIEEVELPRAGFDVACAWHVIEHLADPRPALAKIHDSLRPGGYLLVEVQNTESVYARRKKADWFHLDLERHVGHYNPTALRMLLDRAGFDVLGTETFPMLGYVRPGRALKPLEVAVQIKELVEVRTWPRRSHPSKHELLRAFARRAPDPGSGQ